MLKVNGVEIVGDNKYKAFVNDSVKKNRFVKIMMGGFVYNATIYHKVGKLIYFSL